MANDNKPVIQLLDINFSYNGREVLKNVTLDILERDFLGIIGPNGGGKTTLLKIILGLLKPDNGEVKIIPSAENKAAGVIGYVPQFAYFDRDFPISVLEAVLMGLLNHAPKVGPYRKGDKEKAREALKKVNAEELAERRIGGLSGGELQRVLVARALVSEPPVLLLDEPTASIDYKAEENFFDVLHRLNKEITVGMVSHDIGFVTSHVNRVACLNRQLVCHPTTDISSDVIASLYQTPVDLVAHQHRLPEDDKAD